MTTFEGDEAQPEPEATESRTFSVLSEGDSLDAVCRLLGVSSAARSSSPEQCAQVVEQCRGGVQAVLGSGGAAGIELPTRSLEPLLGCPLSLAQLDACIAGVIERSLETYGSAVSCDMPALPDVDSARLFASPECLSVVLLCPELLTRLAARR